MTGRRRFVTVAAAAVAGAVLTGCNSSNEILPAGEYSGSTDAKQSVVIDVGGTVKLDGLEMRPTPDRWWVGAHDKRLRMRCHTAAHKTEIVCTIDRHGQVETDELLRL